MAQPVPSTATRRDFLKLAGGAAGVAGAPWIARNVQAKPAIITFARESSYVKNFDEHFQKVMVPAYQKATGIKIDYQIQAAGAARCPSWSRWSRTSQAPTLPGSSRSGSTA